MVPDGIGITLADPGFLYKERKKLRKNGNILNTLKAIMKLQTVSGLWQMHHYVFNRHLIRIMRR